jgi:GTP cyclohydrolase II
MMVSDMLLDALGDAQQIAVERALAEFRAARPVAIRSGSESVLAFPVEGLTEKHLPILQQGLTHPSLIVPGAKVKTIANWDASAAAVKLFPFALENVEAFLGHKESHKVPGPGMRGYSVELTAVNQAEAAALALANLSLLLPAAIVLNLNAPALQQLPVLSVDCSSIFSYRDREAQGLKIVTRTFVPLEGVDRSEFVVFRGGDGFRDQIAVIVSNPSPRLPVLVRIHSACLTGDLFGSLKCDCGDQLRGTVRAMSEQGGGIVLYLDQEGRGNGIANKIRAYGLQAEGFDTYDADELLGFGQDQRRFDYAATMLEQLGFTSVRLMTNNPQKINALREAGLEVVSTHRVFARPTPHNVKYLAAKRDKAGHLLGDASLDEFDEEEVVRSRTPCP